MDCLSEGDTGIALVASTPENLIVFPVTVTLPELALAVIWPVKTTSTASAKIKCFRILKSSFVKDFDLTERCLMKKILSAILIALCLCSSALCAGKGTITVDDDKIIFKGLNTSSTMKPQSPGSTGGNVSIRAAYPMSGTSDIKPTYTGDAYMGYMVLHCGTCNNSSSISSPGFTYKSVFVGNGEKPVYSTSSVTQKTINRIDTQTGWWIPPQDFGLGYLPELPYSLEGLNDIFKGDTIKSTLGNLSAVYFTKVYSHALLDNLITPKCAKCGDSLYITNGSSPYNTADNGDVYIYNIDKYYSYIPTRAQLKGNYSGSTSYWDTCSGCSGSGGG